MVKVIAVLVKAKTGECVGMKNAVVDSNMMTIVINDTMMNVMRNCSMVNIVMNDTMMNTVVKVTTGSVGTLANVTPGDVTSGNVSAMATVTAPRGGVRNGAA